MIFRKKRSDKSSLKDEVAMKVVNGLLKIQDKFSEGMSSLTKNISVKSLKIGLVIFCLLSGGSSIYIIAKAIFKTKEEPALKIEGIKMPRYFDQDTGKYIDPGSYEALQSFRRYMDSLQQFKRDSILKTRPRSIDSVVKN